MSQDETVQVTVLDVKTGKKATFEAGSRTGYWWAIGSGSCDCNRGVMAGLETEEERDARSGDNCAGHERFLIVETTPNFKAYDWHDNEVGEYYLEEMNDGYDDELVAKYVGKK